jgi:hypothetical protein
VTDDRSDIAADHAAAAPGALTVDPSDPRVTAAVDRLDELAAKAPAEHVEIYEQVHRDLQDALADAADEGAAAASDDDAVG